MAEEDLVYAAYVQSIIKEFPHKLYDEYKEWLVDNMDVYYTFTDWLECKIAGVIK